MSDDAQIQPSRPAEDLSLVAIPAAVAERSRALLDHVLAIPYGADVRARAAFGGEEEVAAVKAALLLELDALRRSPGGSAEADFLVARLEERAAPYAIPEDATTAERDYLEQQRAAGEADWQQRCDADPRRRYAEVSQCAVCAALTIRHEEPDGQPRWRCAAFPRGIPNDVKWTEIDHRLPLAGDHGIRWSPWRPDARHPLERTP